MYVCKSHKSTPFITISSFDATDISREKLSDINIVNSMLQLPNLPDNPQSLDLTGWCQLDISDFLFFSKVPFFPIMFEVHHHIITSDCLCNTTVQPEVELWCWWYHLPMWCQSQWYQLPIMVMWLLWSILKMTEHLVIPARTCCRYFNTLRLLE